ncbi:MAG TPA: 4-hydroxy-tetrahydrodipicolinate synthase [Bacillota bacterium]|nr:4-hydroxy-tetrahydrodipicolinate synthase [Bacillota bacterium]
MFKPFGVIPALVTPLDEEGNLMEDALRQVIDYTIAGGVHGVFILGSTGEIYGLEWEQKKRAIEITVEHTAGRVPVYAGASEITTRDCIKLAKLAEAIGGVAAVSVLTPYFISPSKTELKEHYLQIAAATQLPVILYGNDDRTHVSIPVDLAVELANVDNIVGIKDSSGDMTKMGEYIRQTRDKEFNVISGRDTLILANLAYGGAGAIAATANIVPAIVAGIYNAFREGDFTRAREYQYQLAPLRIAFGLGSFPVVMKEALRLVGIDAGVTLSPVGPIGEENRAKLAQILKDLGVYQIR